MPGSGSQPRHPFTIRRKLGGLFAMTAALSIVVILTALHQLSRIESDAHKLLEESREANLAHEARFALDLALASLGDRSAPDVDGAANVSTHLADARSRIDEIIEGSRGHDPSDERHQGVEDNLVERIRKKLDEAQIAQRDQQLMHGTLSEVRRLSSVLEEETSVETARSHADLGRRLTRVWSSLILLSIGAGCVLVLAFWLLNQVVLRPVHSLTNGANTFIEGDFEHRISIRSRDEFGDLSKRFNEMAARIAANRDMLERRVEARTREFIKAAKIASLGTLAAGVAHEINTPIASIASCAEGLERRLRSGDIDSEEEFEYLRTIASEAYRVHEITSRLLAFARQDPGPKSVMDVRATAREVEVILRHRLEKSSIALSIEVEQLPALVTGNESELKQVLVNLVSNAVDASRPGQTITLRIRSEETAREGADSSDVIVIEVDDEGSGIADADQSRVFEPFFTTKPPGKGTGLGLALTYAIVEGMHGELTLVDKSAPGTLVRITIPRAQEG
ncbi:MAG: HAMP domain-containing histidine kinase [Planctomycetes bacterium]|nr:HAMP domain-containing histidine kinase [Planctomycetota bacterium]